MTKKIIVFAHSPHLKENATHGPGFFHAFLDNLSLNENGLYMIISCRGCISLDEIYGLTTSPKEEVDKVLRNLIEKKWAKAKEVGNE